MISPNYQNLHMYTACLGKLVILSKDNWRVWFWKYPFKAKFMGQYYNGLKVISHRMPLNVRFFFSFLTHVSKQTWGVRSHASQCWREWNCMHDLFTNNLHNNMSKCLLNLLTLLTDIMRWQNSSDSTWI